MTHTLVFDTETTGLPPRYRTKRPPLESMPWIIQLACILFRDSDREEVAHFSTYVKPSHGRFAGVIPDEQFWQENKLRYDDIAPTFLSLDITLKIFHQFCRRATRLVAHNMPFDAPRIEDSLNRIGAPETNAFFALPKLCTMTTLTPVMKLPHKNPQPWQKDYKWPNLDEAYRHLVSPDGFTGAHDAMSDVRACAAVMYAIEDLSIPLVAT